MNAEQILERTLSGAIMSVDEAVFLDAEASTEALRDAAHTLRVRLHGDNTVTYLVDRNVNYTNVCITDCKFCEFYRPPGHKESYVLNQGDLRQKLRELVDLGGTRVLLQGGHHPDLKLDYYTELLTFIRGEFPELALSAFSPSEIDHIAHVEGITVREVLEALKAAGLDGLPGGGGEILHDDIRNRVSPKKLMTEGWLSCMREAQDLGLVTSCSQVIGFGENPRHRFEALEVCRDLQTESLAKGNTGFLSFVMWPLQAESRFGAVFGDRLGYKLGADEDAYLRHVALSRLFLPNIAHVAASWPTMGPDIAKKALSFGADDFGSTMMEENVVSTAGSTWSCMTEDLICKFIIEAGFAPQKRDADYTSLSMA